MVNCVRDILQVIADRMDVPVREHEALLNEYKEILRKIEVVLTFSVTSH